MASSLPLLNTTQTADPPSSTTNSTTPSLSSTPSSAPPPQLSTPSTPPPSPPAAPPPESPPPPPPSTPPPESPPPPPPSTPASPPPSTPVSPPPSTPTSPPPSTPASPSASPPPAQPTAPPPGTTSPPQPTSPPPATTSPPQTTASPPPPPPSSANPPLPESPSLPAAPPPSPPSPANSPPSESLPTPVVPPSPITITTSPPPPAASPPPSPSVKDTPPPPKPVVGSPPSPTATKPPSNSSPTPSPPSTSLPSPPFRNASNNGSLPPGPLPSRPTTTAEKPSAGSTPSSPNIVSNATPANSAGLSGGGAAVVGSIVGLLAISLMVFAVWYVHKRKRKKDKFSLGYDMPSPFASSQNSDSSFLRSQFSSQVGGSVSASNYKHSPDGGGIGPSKSWFSYQELFGATDGFSEDNLLGEGGFGCVYKGVLVDGRVVAVKQLKSGGGQGEREFRAEVEIISRIHHRHLVSLVGYCISENQRLLVYDYVPNNTLHHHLHAKGKTVMNWASRVKVAAGAARGLAYLHEDCQPRIIHRDIKSTNILLDNNFEARVADFGLAKLALELDLHTHVSTRVMGTFGYLAPEYASTGKLTEKSDVFSFGVVLLELITGRKPIDSSQPLGDESLVEWARPLLTEALDKEEFGGLVDPKLENNFVVSEMFRMIEAAAACVRHLASKRPKMSQVARALDSMEELADLNNGVKPGQSGVFSSREQSAQIRMFQRMAFGSQDYNSSDYLDHSQSSWTS